MYESRDLENFNLVDQAVKKVAIQMYINQAEDQTWSLCRAYLQTLVAVGYGKIIYSKPHIGFNHFLMKLEKILF